MGATAAGRAHVKNILLLVGNFSPLKEPGIKLARAIAQQHGATVFLASTIDTCGKRSNTDVERAMSDFRFVESRYFTGVKHEKVVLSLNTPDCLIHSVANGDIDLVVSPMDGADGCGPGSTKCAVEALFREIGCPVLGVGPSVQEDFGSFASFNNVLYPMEFTRSSMAAIPYIVSLIDNMKSKVSLLHVDPKIPPVAEQRRIRERLKAEMIKLFPSRIQSSIADVVVEFGPIAETITEFSLSRRSDVVVLGVEREEEFTTGTTQMTRSIARQIIAQASCPVITIGEESSRRIEVSGAGKDSLGWKPVEAPLAARMTIENYVTQ